MKKSLIALSMAALPVAAFADVTLYGQIKAGVEVSQTKTKRNGVETKSATTSEIADFGSRIGFKGHEHLGNNLNAIWKVEQKTSVAGTDSGWGNREAYIGLESGAGTIRAGKIGTQLDNMDTIDPWEYNNHALGLDMFTRTGKKVVSARYDTPVFGGFSANVQYSPRDNKTVEVRGVGNPTDGRTDNASDTSAYYGGLNYENAGFFAQYGLGYKKSSYVTAAGQSKSGQAHQVQAGYDANNLFVGLGYQYTDGWDSENSYLAKLRNEDYTSADAAADTSAGLKTHEAAITGAYRFGNVTPRVSYAHGFKPKANGTKLDNGQYNQVVVGADYDFSKRTTAMVSAGWLRAGKSDNKTETTAGLVGLRHKF
ncbi:trimeric porin PorB [Neisseria sp.]|uniref:trimeric porin PorB n=1 Tax=Neisseria sp. TaxID=192066 RepID=UPI0026DB29C5|nr:trimeric porin PorB [Neisseria sp.]MDO4908077.1 trimeric porin PorB [Neisseria sp.]